MNPKFCQVKITSTSAEEAEILSELLLEKKLIASCYITSGLAKAWWKGEILRQEYPNIEAFSILEHKESIIAEVKKIHPDECPIVVFSAIDGNIEFLDWLKESLWTQKVAVGPHPQNETPT